MKFASFFAGIGGFELGLQRAGHECVYACEIDPFARRVYAARFGAKPVGRDVLRVRASSIPDADLWCAGSPCQGFSTAGKRKGLTDSRSGLVMRFLKLARAKKPAWLLIENVPGLLNGKDYACECERLHGADDFEPEPGPEPVRSILVCACGRTLDRGSARPVPWIGTLLGAVADAGYGEWAYRVVDAQYLGVPQRRRRVLILARRSGTAGPSPAEVLFDPPGVRGRAPKGRKARARTAASASRGPGESGVYSNTGQGWWGEGGSTLEAHEAKEPHHLVLAGEDGLAPTVQAHHGRAAPDDQLVIAPCVQASAGHHGRGSPRGDGTDLLIPFDMAQVTHPENRAACEPGSASPTLGATTNLHVAYSVNSATSYAKKDHAREVDVASTLDQTGGFASGQGGTVVGFYVNQGQDNDVDDANPPLKVAGVAGVRRLMPVECERLQAFPDGWTAIPSASDSQRYKTLGNAICVVMAEWIGRRLGNVIPEFYCRPCQARRGALRERKAT